MVKIVERFNTGQFDSELDYLQYLIYQANTDKDILKDILINRTPEYSYTIDNYNHFMSDFRDTKIKHDYEYLRFLAYNIPQYFGETNHSAVFDFDKGEITITKDENGFYNKTFIRDIDLEETNCINELRYLIIDIHSYEEILNDIINKKEDMYDFRQDICNIFFKEYNCLKRKFDCVFQKIIKDCAPEYASDKYFANIDVNNLLLSIYENNEEE